MYSIVPYEHAHILDMIDQPINSGVRDFFLNGEGKNIERTGSFFTGIVDGIPLVCGGAAQIWENRGHCWCVFNQRSKYHFLTVMRMMREFLAQCPFKRIEVSIPVGHAVFARRTELLGFRLECAFAEAYLPNGDDCAVYVMVRE
ncbi:MAG: hypothetical protein ABI351_02365 [Herbaspirillum sp.]